jgi:arginase family enzyme
MARVEDPATLPVLLAGHCSVSLATLPEVASRRPDAFVLWVDAHGDFNSPETTPSGFLGGMCLAAACGVWDSGYGAGLDAHRVVLCGARDLDPAERGLLVSAGVQQALPRPGREALAGKDVFIHLDLDVLDPAEMPGLPFPVPAGLRLDHLHRLLSGVAANSQVVGMEITGCSDPERAAEVADAIADAIAGALR